MEEPSAAPQNALIEEVEMKKRELLLLQTLHQKKKELITLQLKAALASPTVADSVKEDAKVFKKNYSLISLLFILFSEFSSVLLFELNYKFLIVYIFFSNL